VQPVNEEKSVKKLRCIQRSVDRHWVGDGFPVRTLFSQQPQNSTYMPLAE
jgi:quercetin 2,3-dioxygenase